MPRGTPHAKRRSENAGRRSVNAGRQSIPCGAQKQGIQGAANTVSNLSDFVIFLSFYISINSPNKDASQARDSYLP